MKLLDSRRLTGANLFWDRPSAVIDVAIEGPSGPVLDAWRQAALKLLDAAGYVDERTADRVFEGGASLLISAPIDALYSMCELNEVAWSHAVSLCGQGGGQESAQDFGEHVPRLTRLFDEERNPRLLELQRAARKRGVPFLWDDDLVSVGYGHESITWRADKLPASGSVNWDSVRAVPVAMVTGTNGKSTTVRMTASIMKAAGFRAGLTSTDFIRVGERIIDSGDYSGAGGARMLMRQPDVEMAVLEVARGGLLRRGLGLERADAALITNVASDHLGEYGIHTVEALRDVKFILRRALRRDDPLILNADDEGVARYGRALDQRLAWFGLDPESRWMREAIAAGESACFLREGWLVAATPGGTRQIVAAAELPAAMGGVLRYNLSNALAAISLALALGMNDDAIRAGLLGFRGDAEDNPGRGNWFEHEGVRILVDFAHNRHGMNALAQAVHHIGPERVILLLGQAGDRQDRDIEELVRSACAMRPQRLLITELPGYERGRQPFEVPGLIRRYAIEAGFDPDCIELYPGPGVATERALKQARPGDLLVLLALTQREEALERVLEFIGPAGENGKNG